MLDFDIVTLIIGLFVISLLILYMKYKKEKSNTYLFFFFVFHIYLLYVLKYTIFPIPLDMGELFISETRFFDNVNFILFANTSFESLFETQILLNILLSIPFGFGISFIMNLNNKTIIKLALLFGVIIESMQFIISLYLGWTYRVIDINDIFFNFLGVIFGYIAFKLLSIIFIKIIDNNNLKNDNFFNYIYKVCS